LIRQRRNPYDEQKESMTAVHNFIPGDFLIFQLESGFALLRVLAVDENDGQPVWHLAAYKDFFLDPEIADSALENAASLSVEKPHVALTNHAFESTQVAKLRNVELLDNELDAYNDWKSSEEREVHDRSIRLLLGLR